jgi:hypothetical protein
MTRLSALNEIDSIPGTIVDAELRDAFTHRFHVAGIAQGQPTDARIDSSPRLPILQAPKPIGIFIGLPDFDYKSRVSYGIQKGEQNLGTILRIFALWPRGLTDSSGAGFSKARPLKHRC